MPKGVYKLLVRKVFSDVIVVAKLCMGIKIYKNKKKNHYRYQCLRDTIDLSERQRKTLQFLKLRCEFLYSMQVIVPDNPTKLQSYEYNF